MPSDAQSYAKTVIVVPCYNEAQRFSVSAFEHNLQTVSQTAFVLVDDGSSDDTLSLLTSLETRWPDRVSVLSLPGNAGKGEAVRQGMLCALQRSDAGFVGYWDADLATPLESIATFEDTLKRRQEVELVLGARVALLGRDIRRRPARHYLGRIFATVASIVLGLPVYDTQCGAKLLRVTQTTRALFETPFLSKWIFDVELIARQLTNHSSVHEQRAAIYELPLDVWHDIGQSKVRVTDFLRAIGEMVAIFRCYRLAAPGLQPLRALTTPLLRYCGAGVVGTAIHFALLALSVELLALPPTMGTIIGACGGATLNYFLNYHITFVSTRSHGETLPRFLTVAAIGMGLNAGIVGFMSHNARTHYLVSQIAATTAVLLVGFLLNKTWTFGKDHID